MFWRPRTRGPIAPTPQPPTPEITQPLLAQHPQSQPGSGHALLGQELSLASVGILPPAGITTAIVVRGDQTLLSAAERVAATERSRPEMVRDRGGEPPPLDEPAPGIDTRVLSSPSLGNTMPGAPFLLTFRA